MKKWLCLIFPLCLSCVTGKGDREAFYSPDLPQEQTVSGESSPVDYPSQILGFVVVQAPSFEINHKINHPVVRPDDLPALPDPDKATTQGEAASGKIETARKSDTPRRTDPPRRDTSTPDEPKQRGSEKGQETDHAGPPPVERSLSLEPVTASPGKPFRIELPGKGWVYMPGEESGKQVRFMDKQYTAEGTVFVFQLLKDAPCQLSFEKIDHTTGAKQRADARVSSIQSVGRDSVMKVDKAKIVPPEETDLPGAVKAKDRKLVASLLDNPVVFEKTEPEMLLKAWRLFKGKKEYEDLQERLLETLLQYYPEDQNITPELLYFWALILESDTSRGSLKLAYSLYNTVYSQYPVSPWSGKAHKRMIYLDRHYFKVR